MPKVLFATLVVNDPISSTGTAASFTMPRDGRLFSAYIVLDFTVADTSVLALQIVRGAVTYTMFSKAAGGTAHNYAIGGMNLLRGDVIRWEVVTADAGETADFTLFGEYLDAG